MKPSPAPIKTAFGLGAALWTRGRGGAHATLARRIERGSGLRQTELVASDPRLPFGGHQNIRVTGASLGSYGLKEFVNIKSLWIGPAR